MDAKAPTGTSTRHAGVTNYAAGPNGSCAGNYLFPVWLGDVQGAPTGDAKVTLFLTSTGNASLEVRLFADVEAQLCNADSPQPLGVGTAVMVPGESTLTVNIKGINKKNKMIKKLMVQVMPTYMPTIGPPLTLPPFVARISYDSTTAKSAITSACLPRPGKKTC